MATPFQPWNPEIPNFWPMYPETGGGGWRADPKYDDWQMPDWFGKDKDWWQNAKQRDAAKGWMEAQLPAAQFDQNRYQYAKDFNEAQRRFNQEFGWGTKRDTFNMNLSAQQQKMAEWVAQNQQGNWEKQFAHTQGQDIWGRGFSEKQLEAQNMQSRYQAFGRAQAPSAQWARSW